MATALENLINARDAIAEVIATHAGKPNYSIDGQSVSYESLMNQLDALNRQIAAVGGPFDVVSEVMD